jgi:hypothetical protein
LFFLCFRGVILENWKNSELLVDAFNKKTPRQKELNDMASQAMTEMEHSLI